MAGNRNYEMMIQIAGNVNRNLNSSISNANKHLKSIGDTANAANKRIAQIGSQFSNLGNMAKTAASVMVGAFAGIQIGGFVKDGISEALEFESSMADVAKVVDGLKDENNKTTKSYEEMSNQILKMTRDLPMTANELAQIMAAAGQANIAAGDLVQFTETAAKMGIAFDVTAQQAGEWMAQWRTAFKMSQEEVTVLSDKINYLSNTSSENAIKLSGVVSRIGALGEISGVSAAEIAAMAASMTGVSEEISATGIKNLMKAANAGSAATKTQQGVLAKLGFSATEMAKRMQVDAKGAILDLLEAFKKLPEEMQSAEITEYFGSESVAAIAPLISNLENLKENFEKVGEAGDYLNSMQNEFASRAATGQNQIQLAKNAIGELQIVMGNQFLPVVSRVAARFTGFVHSITDGVPKFLDFTDAVKNGSVAFGKGHSFLTSFKPALMHLQKALPSMFGETIGGALAQGIEGIAVKADVLIEKLKPKLPLIEESARYFATSFIDGIGRFFNGESLSVSFGESLKGLSGIAEQIYGTEAAQFLTDIGTSFLNIGDIVMEVIPIIIDMGSEIMDNAGFVISGIASIANDLAPVIGNMADTFMKYLPDILPVFDEVSGAVGDLIKTIGETLQKLAPIFAEAFDFVIQKIIPAVMPVFQNLGLAVTRIVDTMSNAFKLIVDAITVLWPLAQPGLELFMGGIQFGFGFVSGVIANAVEIIAGVIDNVFVILGGVITFVKGVFTNDWELAWQGVRDIFGGIFESLAGLLKTPLNATIALINSAIDGINNLNVTIPDWVPGLGGKTFDLDLKKLPMLAKGSNYSPDTFIAGEKGAELITNAKGSKVFTALQTKNIFNNISKFISGTVRKPSKSSAEGMLIDASKLIQLPREFITKDTSKPSQSPMGAIPIDANKLIQLPTNFMTKNTSKPSQISKGAVQIDAGKLIQLPANFMTKDTSKPSQISKRAVQIDASKLIQLPANFMITDRSKPSQISTEAMQSDVGKLIQLPADFMTKGRSKPFRLPMESISASVSKPLQVVKGLSNSANKVLKSSVVPASNDINRHSQLPIKSVLDKSSKPTQILEEFNQIDLTPSLHLNVNFNITIQGNATEKEIVEGVKQSQWELERVIEKAVDRIMANRRRTSLGGAL